MSQSASPQIEIAITGRGVVSSIGDGADAFVDALLERRSGIVDGLAPCSEFDPEAVLQRLDQLDVDSLQVLSGVASRAPGTLIDSSWSRISSSTSFSVTAIFSPSFMRPARRRRRALPR